jgi:3-dehydroquinate synthetase
MDYFVHDKKNHGDKPQFVLLEAVGKPVWNMEVERDLVKASLLYIIKVSRQ